MKGDIRLRGVKRVVRVTLADDYGWLPLTLYKKKTRKRRKVSRAMRPIEKAIRRKARANQVFSDTFLGRHSKSSSKRRDGWLRDLNYNMLRAHVKSERVLNR